MPFVKKLTWAHRHRRGWSARPAPAQTLAHRQRRHGVPGGGGRHQMVLDGIQSCHRAPLRPGTREAHPCTRVRPSTWKAGSSFTAGPTRNVAGEAGQKVLRARGYPERRGPGGRCRSTGPATSWGGALATAGGLVFYGDDSGAFAAVDAATGARLWQFQTNAALQGVAHDVCLRRPPGRRGGGRALDRGLRAVWGLNLSNSMIAAGGLDHAGQHALPPALPTLSASTLDPASAFAQTAEAPVQAAPSAKTGSSGVPNSRSS